MRQQYLLTENEDGSLLLEPAVVLSQAQREYDSNPDLQAPLARATGSATVRRERRRHGSGRLRPDRHDARVEAVFPHP